MIPPREYCMFNSGFLCSLLMKIPRIARPKYTQRNKLTLAIELDKVRIIGVFQAYNEQFYHVYKLLFLFYEVEDYDRSFLVKIHKREERYYGLVLILDTQT